MIDNIKIVLANAKIDFNMKENGFWRYGHNRQNPDVIPWMKYIHLDKEKQVELKKYIDTTNEEEIKEEINKHKLKIIVNENTKFNEKELVIIGSIRKWYFGINSTQDFTKKRFEMCIDSISDKLGFEDKSLWNAKVTKLETGVTLKLKSRHKGIVNCIYDYKDFVKNTYGKYGVEFKSVNYDVIFYDQLRRIYNRKGKKQRSYNKIDKNNFIFRYEIQSHKISGTPMFKGKLDTLLKIRSNWKYIGENLIDTLDKVSIKNVISPDIYIDIVNGAKTTMNHYLVYEGIKTIGVENHRILLSQMKNKKRSEYKKYYLELFEKYEEKDEENYDVILRHVVKKKIKRLL